MDNQLNETGSQKARELAEQTLAKITREGDTFVQAMNQDSEDAIESAHKRLAERAIEAVAAIEICRAEVDIGKAKREGISLTDCVTEVRIRLSGPGEIGLICSRVESNGRFEVIAIEGRAGAKTIAVGPDERQAIQADIYANAILGALIIGTE